MTPANALGRDPATLAAVTAEAMPRAMSLRTFALAAVAMCLQDRRVQAGTVEATYLQEHHASAALPGKPWHARLGEYLKSPTMGDLPILALARELNLTLTEVLATALATAVEDDVMVGRALAFLQAPVGGSRPTLGLLGHSFADLPDQGSPLDLISSGAAQQTGLLSVIGEGPLPERAIAVPVPSCLALRGVESAWQGVLLGRGDLPEIPLAATTLEEARRHASALAGAPSRTLVIRCSSPIEARAAARAVASSLGRRPAFVETDRVTSLAPWLILRELLPVFCYSLAPGEQRAVPALAGYRGPVIVTCGPDGSVQSRGEAPLAWRIAVPPRPEREVLWRDALGDPELARSLADEHRHSSGRIAELARGARHVAAIDGRDALRRTDLAAATWLGDVKGLCALAQPITDIVTDEALVTTPRLREELVALASRCLARDRLTESLGPAARARYHPGVRALFVGPSGTGKTLAASWLATRLGIPLYRVDLASVTSKYIGETEKNLAELIARAEHAEIALLFDEADSLFGKRTDIKDANDRFANAQTNYLLQRIETFDGIAVLTSNSRTRFDSAFSRRLDAIVEFALPGPEERRAIWVAHLGPANGLESRELNQLAATVDLAGGHVRNAVLAAAAAAHTANRTIGYPDLVRGITSEYRKLGRQVPAGLERSTQ